MKVIDGLALRNRERVPVVQLYRTAKQPCALRRLSGFRCMDDPDQLRVL